jgi:hypothetical protein
LPCPALRATLGADVSAKTSTPVSARSAILWLRTRWPWVTGLASYPSDHFSQAGVRSGFSDRTLIRVWGRLPCCGTTHRPRVSSAFSRHTRGVAFWQGALAGKLSARTGITVMIATLWLGTPWRVTNLIVPATLTRIATKSALVTNRHTPFVAFELPGCDPRNSGAGELCLAISLCALRQGRAASVCRHVT